MSATISFVRQIPTPRCVTVTAEPQSVEVDLARTALLIVDMQNDFLHPDGWFGLSGIDPGPARTAIAPVAVLAAAARHASVQVVWLNWGVRPDAANLPAFAIERGRDGGRRPTYGEPSSSGQGGILTQNDWGAANVDELPVAPVDLVVHKHRLSGFWDNELDSILRRRQVTTLVFAGINTDRCVFATLTDAAFIGYDCILAADACATSSPAFVTDAVLFLVRQLYGVVVRNDALTAAFALPPPS